MAKEIAYAFDLLRPHCELRIQNSPNMGQHCVCKPASLWLPDESRDVIQIFALSVGGQRGSIRHIIAPYMSPGPAVTADDGNLPSVKPVLALVRGASQ